MSEVCDRKELIVEYLYGECDADERARFERHLLDCPECTAEVAALTSVRAALADWAPPAPALGFKIVREPVRPRATWPLPAWAQAIAAILLLAVAAAVANIEVRYGPDGLVITTGWRRAAPAVTASAGAERALPTGTTGAPWRADLASLERQLRHDFIAPRGVQLSPAGSAAGATDNDLLLRRVRTLIAESERQQQRAWERELALRVAEVVRDVDSQRRADLVRIEQGLGQLEGRTGMEAAQQREILNYLVRVSQKQ